jgi:hypothetical protein
MRLLILRTSRAVSTAALLLNLLACGSADQRERLPPCAEDECAGAGGSGSNGLLDCPELCREVEACSDEPAATCSKQCENTLSMASSLGCGPDYAGYVNCVLEAGDACVRERPPECADAYATLDGCLCAAVPENCP